MRPCGIPASLRNVCIISLRGDLGKIGRLLSENPAISPKLIIIPDMPEKGLAEAEISIKDEKILVAPLSAMNDCPQYDKIFICPDNAQNAAAYLSYFASSCVDTGIFNIYLYALQPPTYTTRQPLPNFYNENKALLEQAYDIFRDDASRKTFAGRLKAILAGDSAYIPIASHQEYFHPLVHPEKGDIMIDGGVSDMVGSQKDFAKAVGPQGHVFGFEPIPAMARAAAKTLAPFANYHLQCAGLADKPGKAVFEEMRDSSHLSAKADVQNGIECDMETIDEFCRKNHLGRIDCIKLDVEGAELAALKGAENTVRKCHPKLIICLYHKPVDMYEIPLYLKSIAPEYHFLLTHSSCQFIDTVLYARAPKVAN